MVGVDKDKGYVVVFSPDGKSAAVAAGTTILAVSSAAGISLHAVCGGEGKCGRCKVRPEGKFSAAKSALLSSQEAAAGT